MTNRRRKPSHPARGLLRALAGCLAGALYLVSLEGLGFADDPFLRRTATVRAVEKVGPAVVSIATENLQEGQNPFSRQVPRSGSRRYFSDLFESRGQSSFYDLGSGVIISPEKHILTNEHVIRQARRITITLADGRSFAARIVGADPSNDVAVLQVETEEDLPWVEPGTSSDIMVGEPVIAIGNPFGFSNTVTTGVISALDRSIRTEELAFHGFLQTDASINPGNSGGPLVNAEGSLIGINTALYQHAEGIGFAIPIDVARRVVAELIEHGEVHPVTLGIGFQDLDPALREIMALPGNVAGPLINRVLPGGPAHTSGVRRGDVLTRLDGRDIQSAKQLSEILETTTPEQRLMVEFWRDGELLITQVVALKIPENVTAELSNRLLGLSLEARKNLGFVVTNVRKQSPAALEGLGRGDLLIAINGLVLDSDEALRRAIFGLRGRERALIVVQRGRGRYHLNLPLR